MGKSDIIAVVDVGTSKIVCLIAQADSHGVQVLGIGHQLSEGIRAGLVIDIKKAENSILAAVNAAEKMAGLTIDSVVVNISGSTLESHRLQVEANIANQEITERDITQMIQKGRAEFERAELHIIHALPVDYTIDDTPGIKDPRGMFGSRLHTNLHIITASNTAVRNLANCLARCHLNAESYVCSPYVSGLACLNEDERNLGVTLLDIGAGNTSISVFHSGECIYVDSVAIGGEHITRDIARGLSTSVSYAERLKTLYGSVINTPSDEREMIDIQQADSANDDEYALGTGERSHISKALLTSIIKPRVEEIFELTRRNIARHTGLSAIAGPRLVLTGGSAQISGMRELANHAFQKHVRIASPTAVEGLADMARSPAFSTAIGALNYAAQHHASANHKLTASEKTPRKESFRRVMQWFQKNF